jgi:hypothetical protein
VRLCFAQVLFTKIGGGLDLAKLYTKEIPTTEISRDSRRLLTSFKNRVYKFNFQK